MPDASRRLIPKPEAMATQVSGRSIGVDAAFRQLATCLYASISLLPRGHDKAILPECRFMHNGSRAMPHLARPQEHREACLLHFSSQSRRHWHLMPRAITLAPIQGRLFTILARAEMIIFQPSFSFQCHAAAKAFHFIAEAGLSAARLRFTPAIETSARAGAIFYLPPGACRRTQERLGLAP